MVLDDGTILLNPDALYTIPEIVKYRFLGLKEGTIYKMIKAGDIDYVDVGKKRSSYRILGSVIMNFREDQTTARRINAGSKVIYKKDE